MRGVTADTSIYISAFEFGGLPRRLIDLAASGAFRLDISESILAEILRLLRRKFKWNPEALRGVEEDIRSFANLVDPAPSPDTRILACAVAAQSHFIVSADTRHLLPLGKFEGIEILSVAAFLELPAR